MEGLEARLDEYITCVMETQRSLYAYILAQVPNLSEADDVLQETNLVLWGKRDEFSMADNFRGMIFQVARLQVLAHRKRRHWDKSGFDPALIEQLAAEAGQRSDRLEDKRQALAECLAQLRPRDRQMIHERYTQGLSGKQLAARWGRTVDSVFHSLYRIRGILVGCIRRKLAMEDRA